MKALPTSSFLLILLLCTGCSKEDPADTSTDTDADADADTDADADADTDSDTDPASSPVVTSADAYCYLHEVGKTYYQWMASCSFGDPQGVKTVSSFEGNSIIVSSAGTELVTYDLACGEGSCMGSFKESDNGVLCANASSYSLAFQVMDEDGNLSAPFAVNGRQQ